MGRFTCVVSQLHILTIPGSIPTANTIIRTVAPSCNPATGGQGYGMVLNTIHIDVDLKSGLFFTAGNVVPP